MFYLLSRPEEMLSRAWIKCVRIRARVNDKVYKHTRGYFRSVKHSCLGEFSRLSIDFKS
jgi:hypothetical protein